MMKYEQIWNAVDKLAKLNKLSPSGLAKKAGLDSTTFNKSKRIRPDGKKRWPSLESINRITSVCNISFDDFLLLCNEGTVASPLNTVPNLPLSALPACFALNSKNRLNTQNWKHILFPDFANDLFAVTIDDDNLSPLYPKNAVLIVSKNVEFIKQNSRVLVMLKDKSAFVAQFVRKKAGKTVFADVNDTAATFEIAADNIALINKVMWVNQ